MPKVAAGVVVVALHAVLWFAWPHSERCASAARRSYPQVVSTTLVFRTDAPAQPPETRAAQLAMRGEPASGKTPPAVKTAKPRSRPAVGDAPVRAPASPGLPQSPQSPQSPQWAGAPTATAAPAAEPPSASAPGDEPLNLALPPGSATAIRSPNPALQQGAVQPGRRDLASRLGQALRPGDAVVIETMANGRQRVRQGSSCYEMAPSRMAELDPFGRLTGLRAVSCAD